MNRMRIGGLAAGMFVVGLMAGMAGTAVAREDARAADCPAVMTEHMAGQQMTAMMSMMGGSMMGGSMMGGSMMGGSMMGGPGPSMAPDMMGPDDSGMAGPRHEVHHGQVAPETAE